MVTVRVPRSFPINELVPNQRIRLTGQSATGDAEYDFTGVFKQFRSETSMFCLILEEVRSSGLTRVSDGDGLYFEPKTVTPVSGDVTATA